MSSDIYRNKIDFAREEFSTELPRPKGIPKPREAKSQVTQYEHAEQHNLRKDKKVPMEDKLR
jgi:hypothetical protein